MRAEYPFKAFLVLNLFDLLKASKQANAIWDPYVQIVLKGNTLLGLLL